MCGGLLGSPGAGQPVFRLLPPCPPDEMNASSGKTVPRRMSQMNGSGTQAEGLLPYANAPAPDGMMMRRASIDDEAGANHIESTVNMVNGILGAGLLGIPFAFRCSSAEHRGGAAAQVRGRGIWSTWSKSHLECDR